MWKSVVKVFCIITIFGGALLLYSYESPGWNYNSKLSADDCIKLDENLIGLGDFLVRYIENSSTDCTNPYFPTMHIRFLRPHNAWLQIVRTNVDGYRVFIDSVDKNTNPELYPFYTMDDDFYDAPLWTYRIWHDGVEWVAHLYPISIDFHSKVVTFSQGLLWGFRFGNYRLRPVTIKPTIISRNDIESDWLIFKNGLNGYRMEVVE